MLEAQYLKTKDFDITTKVRGLLMIPRGHFGLVFGITTITQFGRVCVTFQSKKSAPGLRTRLGLTTQTHERHTRFAGNPEIIRFDPR